MRHYHQKRNGRHEKTCLNSNSILLLLILVIVYSATAEQNFNFNHSTYDEHKKEQQLKNHHMKVTSPNISVTHHWVFQTNASLTYVHMSTIAKFSAGHVVTAFQASSISEGCNDQSIFISSSNDDGVTWSPVQFAQHDTYALWGPVLYVEPKAEILWLFYTASTEYQKREDPNCGGFGRSYPGGEVRFVTSKDRGKTWSQPRVILSFQAHGPVGKMTANPLIVTETGRWMLPYWQEPHTVYDKGIGAAGVLVSDDNGVSWVTYGSIHNNATWLIENTLFQYQSGEILQMFRSKAGFIYESWSHNNGETWATATPGRLLNPDSKVCLSAKATGNGAAVLAYNPSQTARRPLVLSQSFSRETGWQLFATLDKDSSCTYQYPTVLVSGDTIFTTYSADTRVGIKLAVATFYDYQQ